MGSKAHFFISIRRVYSAGFSVSDRVRSAGRGEKLLRLHFAVVDGDWFHDREQIYRNIPGCFSPVLAGSPWKYIYYIVTECPSAEGYFTRMKRI